MKFAKLLIPCVLILASVAPTAKAHDGGLGLSMLFGYQGFNQFGMNTTFASPPYFALHPPVYYGKRYTRPYGASPFAAWPQLQATPGYAPAPHVDRASTIMNPHCHGCTVPGAVLPGNVISSGQGGIVNSTQIVEPLVIDNPYYQPNVQYTGKLSKERAVDSN